MKYTDSSWSTRQKSFYIDELLTATKNEPFTETHVRMWTLPREEEEIMGNLSFKSPKSVLGKAMENTTPGIILLWHGNESSYLWSFSSSAIELSELKDSINTLQLLI